MSLFRYSVDVSETVRKKVKFFVVLVVFSFLCLWMRVWYLQILQGQNFKGLSENNRIRQISLSPYRGIIKDRNGETLVSIRPSFNLYITPEDIGDLIETLGFLSEKIPINKIKLRRDIKAVRAFKDVLVKSDINWEEVAFVEENKMRLPGVRINVEPLRNYVYNDFASHALGYLGEISKAKLEGMKNSVYRQGDLVGKRGIERVYESVLRGEKGYEEVEVDVSGRELRTVRKLPPKSGEGLILTLDARIQKVVEQLMTGTPESPVSGSIVVIKVQTGEIMALVSKPSFDANLFAAGISKENWKKLILDERHPLQNRAIDGQYPPASTYKIVTALAALEEKVITPEATVYCPGHFKLGKGRYRCWKKRGHGAVNMHTALVQSCDVFFYTMGYRLGIDRLAKYAKELGLGSITGIGLKGEKPGLIPTTTWKLAARKQPWLAGETISASIGQGFNLITPIQQANMVATLANGGILLKPYLIKSIEDSDGKVLKEFYPEITRKINIKPESLKLVLEAMRGVVNEPHGTGYRARLKNIKVSGKTGTAQVVRMKPGDQRDGEKTPYQFQDHAWFVAFAPFEKPEISVSVIVEHGGHGGSVAAPLARKIIKTYFDLYPLSNVQSARKEDLKNAES